MIASVDAAFPQPQSVSSALLEAQLLLLGTLLGSMTDTDQQAFLAVRPKPFTGSIEPCQSFLQRPCHKRPVVCELGC